MIYEYITDNGLIIERDYKFGQAPKMITIDGKKAYRTFSFHSIIHENNQAVKTKSVR